MLAKINPIKKMPNDTEHDGESEGSVRPNGLGPTQLTDPEQGLLVGRQKKPKPMSAHESKSRKFAQFIKDEEKSSLPYEYEPRLKLKHRNLNSASIDDKFYKLLQKMSDGSYSASAGSFKWF